MGKERQLQEFIVERPKWYRGKGGVFSRLLIDTGSHAGEMCCVGFWCKQILQLTDDELGGIAVMEDTTRALPIIHGLSIKDHEALSKVMGQIYSTNDRIQTTEEDREERLTELFSWIGYKPVFVD